MSKTQLYMNLGLLVITAIVFVVMVGRTKLKEDKELRKKLRDFKLKWHWKFYTNFLLRGPYRRILQMLATLSCYDEDVVKTEAVDLFVKTLAICISIPIITLFLMKDSFLALIMVFLSYVYYQATIESRNDKIYVQLMEECSLTISSIREKYMETDSIPLAILYAEKSKLLEAPLANIYRILSDVGGYDRLLNFQRSYPIPIVKTLANTCYILNENGVVTHDDGSNSFSDAMTTLRQECDSEIRRLTKQRIAFNSLKNLTFVGLGVCPVSELYLLNMIPGTSSLLKGSYGFYIHLAVVVLTIIAYRYITTSCRPSVVNSSDRINIINQLLNVQRILEFSRKIQPKKSKPRAKLNRSIQNALSTKDIDYIYIEKTVFSVGLFIIGGLMLVFGTVTVRSNFYNNYNSLSFIPSTQNEDQQKQIVLLDNDIMAYSREEFEEAVTEMKDDNGNDIGSPLYNMVKGRITGVTDAEAQEQVKRLKTKYNGYHGAVFHWWWPLVMLAMGIVGWFIPNGLILLRSKVVQYEATADVSQLQTMMIVLSDTKMDVYKAITWLEKQAVLHKQAISLCHYTYVANPMKALDVLESSSPINDFKRIVRKMKSAVYTLSLRDAFSDVKLDKAQSMSVTEMLRTEELELRKNNAKLIAIAPAAVALIGSFIGPVLILGISQMSETFAQLGNM